MRRKHKFLLLIPILSIAASLTTALVMIFIRTCVSVSDSNIRWSEENIYSSTIQQDNPILLTGNDILLIEDTDYRFTSSLTAKDNAKIRIKGSRFTQTNNGSGGSHVIFTDNASIEIIDSTIDISGWTPWEFIDTTSMIQSNVKHTNTNLWLGFEDHSTANFKESLFRGSVMDAVQLNIDMPDKRSSIEFRFPDNSVVDEPLPSNMTQFNFPNSNDTNIKLRVDIANAEYIEWSIVMASSADVTIRDGQGINITMDTTESIDLSAELTDLKTKYYEDSAFSFRGGSIRLLETGITSWNLILTGNNKLTIRDSDIANLLSMSGSSQLHAYTTSIDLLSVRDDAYANIQTGVILGDIIVDQNGMVELTNTKLVGDITKLADGEVLIK